MAEQQPENIPNAHFTLTQVAEQMRKDLMTKNGYKPATNMDTTYEVDYIPGDPKSPGEYGEMNPDAISDGDGRGRGYMGSDIGKDLPDSVGNVTDQQERKIELVKNTYKPTNEYPNFG